MGNGNPKSKSKNEKEGQECKHDKTNGHRVRVTNIVTGGKLTGQLMAEIRIECGECGRPFRFQGVDSAGVSLRHPTTCPEALVLRAPMIPATDENNPLAQVVTPPVSKLH